MPVMGDRGGSPVRADERLRFLFAVARDPLLLLDGDEAGVALDARTIIDCNRAAAALLGYRPSQLAGRPFATLEASSPDDPGGSLGGSGDRLLRRADGQVLVVEAAVEDIESGGRPLVLVSLHDVTTPRLLEKALFRMQQMDNLGVVSGAMVHDFRNLLVSISASAELALQPGESDDTIRQRLGDIVASAARANEIVERVLPTSRAVERPLAPLDLEPVVASTVAMVGMALARHHAVQLAFPSDLPRVLGDESHLRQLVMNLLLNASQAIGDRTGTISLSGTLVALDEVELSEFRPALVDQHDRRWVLFEVRDDGRGIDAATRARIFEPLFTTRTTGTGLGLTAVLVAVRRHRGAIAVRSRPGRGATFRVLLPADTAETR